MRGGLCEYYVCCSLPTLPVVSVGGEEDFGYCLISLSVTGTEEKASTVVYAPI